MVIIMGINIINISYICGVMLEILFFYFCSFRCIISMCSVC